MGTTPTGDEESRNSMKMVNIEEELEQIQLLPIFNKISICQALLKELISKKERFDENKNKMIEKIKSYTYLYYRNIIYSKEIYDNCKLQKDNSGRYTCIINKDTSSIEKDYYLPIYNFLFFLRNNNKYMLKILNRCNTNYYQKLSYFIAHLCYENTISNNNIFIQDELQLIIYFLIERIIFRNPDEILTYNNEYFLYKLLEHLIMKVDLNNFLNSLLTDLILDVEKGKNSFILELVKKDDRPKKQKTMLMQKGKMQTDIRLQSSYKEERMSYDQQQKLLDRMKKKDENVKKEIKKEVKKEIGVGKVDDFFIKNDTTFEFISQKLTYYENLKEKDQISLGMIYFLENHFKNLTSENEKEDDNTLYRNNYFFALFDGDKIENKEEKQYIENIKKLYILVINFISSLIIKIQESLSNIPKAIKNILNILSHLIEKKMANNEKKEKIIYYLFMSKLKIFIGNLILPAIKNFYNTGIIGENILSRSTTEFLKTIEMIINAISSGKLFHNKKDREYTIYNKFIIEIFPKFLNLSLNLGLNDNNSQNKKDTFSLISTKLLNSFEQVKDNNRIINYNELKDNKYNKNLENIQYQSICFNWEILYMLAKTIEKEKEYFINKENVTGENQIFEDFLKIFGKITEFWKDNQLIKEYEYFFIDKIIYKKEFEEKINYIVQDIFDVPMKTDNLDGEIIRFKKSLSVILGYVGELHKENFLPFIVEKENIKICSNIKSKLFLDYKRNNKYNKTEFEMGTKDKNNTNKQKIKENYNKDKKKIYIQDSDSFFKRRKSVVCRWLEPEPEDDKKDETDFKSVFFPEIMSLVRTEIGNSFESEKFQKIIFCISYIQTHFDNLPNEYKKNNYSQIFSEIITETKILILELQNNVLNEFVKKIRHIERINEIINKYYLQNKITEKFFYIKYLYKKAKVYGKLTIKKNKNNEITNIKYVSSPANESKLDTIKTFVRELPNFTEYENKLKDKDDLLKYQQNIGLVNTVTDYFKELRNFVNKVSILSKLPTDEYLQVLYTLENHILKKLYSKFFPIKYSKEDNFLYKKCARLSFIKPGHIIKDQKFKKISEKLLKISIDNVKEMNNKKTPMEKINTFGRALNFLKNSMEFNSGKEGFGIDDLLPILIYIVIKAKIENLCSNYNYCLMYLNSDLQKRQYGSMLTQIGVIIDIIKNMKYTDLSGVTKEQFGVDEKE